MFYTKLLHLIQRNTMTCESAVPTDATVRLRPHDYGVCIKTHIQRVITNQFFQAPRLFHTCARTHINAAFRIL